MRTIWKFGLNVEDMQFVQMPADAEVLCVHVQHGIPMLWALVSPDAPIASRMFVMHGTGHPVGNVGRYVGTFQLSGGALVFHVFEAA